jgi:hypothetical protein
MGLRDQLRKTEREISNAARQGISRAQKELADAEQRIRRKMRIYPEKFVASDAPEEQETGETAALRPPVGGHAAEQLRDPEATAAGRAIVSIHGRDLKKDNDAEDDDCGHLIQSR